MKLANQTSVWPLALRVAKQVGGTYPLEHSYHIDSLAEVMPGIVRDVGVMVEAETGLLTPADPVTEVVSREQWSERTLQFFKAVASDVAVGAALSEPPESTSLAVGAGSDLTEGTASAVQTGALVGFMSKRVLGQYELVLPSSGRETDSIFFVGPNILALERQHQFNPSEFRTWIALHECAHRAQFLGVPWMRGYFLGLVKEMTAAGADASDRVGPVISKAIASFREGVPFIDDSGLMGLVASPEQLRTLDRVQALMSLLEGHGHAVMNRLGAEMLHTQKRMAALLKGRSQDAKTAFILKLSGLQMKMRQYEDGEKFIGAVERIAGWDAVSAAWESPNHLPTIDEIADPHAWLRRIG
jgi:coenzyme F420 biosynthesis associated uncharacterized protein